MKQKIKCWCYRCAAPATGLVAYLSMQSTHGWHIGHPFF